MTTARFPDLENASVFITGGGSGIGAYLTEGFLRQGARVAFVGRSDASDFVAEMEEKTGARPLFLQCDATDTPALHAAMDEAATANGPFAVHVNNAANDQRYDPMEVTVEDWDAMQAINIRHQFFAAQKAAQIMKARGGGSIVNYTSTSYMLADPMLSVYIAAKAGITGLTRSLAQAWGPDRIRVNAIAPGWVLTEKQMDKWATEEKLEEHRDRQALKDFMKPEDMVGPTLFLASDASRMMTGQCMVVDAGTVFTG